MPAKILITFLAWLLSMPLLASVNNEQPDLELLEFLGSFETPDGKWLDPMEIEKMPEQILVQETPSNIDELPQQLEQTVNDNE